MSEARGRIERAIADIFDAAPDNAFTTEELCERIYRYKPHVQKAQRVVVLRAGKVLSQRRPEISMERGEGLGGQYVFYRRDRIGSYAMFRMKADNFNRYRSNDRRRDWTQDEAALRKELLNDEWHRQLMAPGGAWWRHVEMFIAERDGDNDKLDALQRDEERALAARMAPFRRL